MYGAVERAGAGSCAGDEPWRKARDKSTTAPHPRPRLLWRGVHTTAWPQSCYGALLHAVAGEGAVREREHALAVLTR